jgi:hypothetical protein
VVINSPSFALSDWHNLDLLSFNSFEQPIFLPQAVTCPCNPPTIPGTEGAIAAGTCGVQPAPVPAALPYSSNNNWMELNKNVAPQNSPTVSNNVAFAPINKDRVKLCKYAGRQPLEMVKKNCGACAIRKCDIYGLCTHTSIVEGRDDVYCCQLCDKYDDGSSVKMQKNADSINLGSVPVGMSTIIAAQELLAPKIDQPSSVAISSIADAAKITDKLTENNEAIKIAPINSTINIDVQGILEGKDHNDQKL